MHQSDIDIEKESVMKILIATAVSFLMLTSAANAETFYLHYTLKSGSKGVQGGYSSYKDCMKAGNGSASFSAKIASFFCSKDP
jgi:hypothetical protein